jgi:predicted amidohydrolase
MTVLMSNCVGRCDNFDSAGKSAIWNDQGLLLGQLNDTDEGIIIINTATQEIIEKYEIISPASQDDKRAY